jgi:hypothetical protein
MRKLITIAGAGLFLAAAPAAAHHVDHLDEPFATRGACEAERQALSNDDDFLIDQFPMLFSSEGEVRSFLNRAFTCEPAGDGNWYIRDHRLEVLASDWFKRRL